MIDFLISNAYAQTAPAQGGSSSFLIMMVVFFGIFYFMLMRPQMKQAKEHKKLIENLAKGDEVIAGGGILGKISEVGDNFIVLEVAKDTEIKIQKHAVNAVMPKGTIKGL